MGFCHADVVWYFHRLLRNAEVDAVTDRQSERPSADVGGKGMLRCGLFPDGTRGISSANTKPELSYTPPEDSEALGGEAFCMGNVLQRCDVGSRFLSEQ